MVGGRLVRACVRACVPWATHSKTTNTHSKGTRTSSSSISCEGHRDDVGVVRISDRSGWLVLREGAGSLVRVAGNAMVAIVIAVVVIIVGCCGGSSSVLVDTDALVVQALACVYIGSSCRS